MHKRILVLGAAGMAGHIIVDFLSKENNFTIDTIARNKDFVEPTYTIDLRDKEALREILVANKYDIVINASGLLNAQAENFPDDAVLINTFLPLYLSRLGKEIGFKLIHISTDCVFSGRDGQYNENSLKDGEGYYSTTKALGEIDVPEHLTFRTSIIGPELKNDGIGLFSWFAKQSGEISGYKNAIWSGVTTLVLAKAIRKAIDSNLTGLYHLTNNKQISKFDLLQVFKRELAKDDVIIVGEDNKKVDKSIINTRSDFSFVVPDYDEMIHEMVEQIEMKKSS